MLATILFRGLLVFHQQGNVMEIGFLNAPGVTVPPNRPPTMEEAGHVPRILTFVNGTIKSVLDLRTRPELDIIRPWEIEVSNPLQPTATTYTNGPTFDRLHHTDPEDFRWIADLEGPDLHDRDLTSELDKRHLRFVLTVPHGQFRTRMQSKPQTRIKKATGATQPFGRAAEVTECRIEFNGGTVKLKVQGATAFDFLAEPGATYEISNLPPDVSMAAPPNKAYAGTSGHFHMYYHHLFKTHPRDEYDLMPENGHPAPDPYLCGLVGLSRSREPL